jgi:type IV pilus assembly PilO-like protein
VSDLLHNKKALIAAGAAFALVLIGGWFLLVAPQRSKADDLAQKVDAARATLTQRQDALRHPAAQVTIRASDGYRLSTALPRSVDVPGVIYDVQRLAAKHKLSFSSIKPEPTPVVGNGYTATPVAVEVQGRFSDLSNFLGELRSLVQVRHGRLHTHGRLYSVGGVDIGAPQDPATFPVVLAKVTLNAYAFSAPAEKATTTPSTPSSGQSSSENVAAGANP